MLDPGRPLPVCVAQLCVKEQMATGKNEKLGAASWG